MTHVANKHQQSELCEFEGEKVVWIKEPRFQIERAVLMNQSIWVIIISAWFPRKLTTNNTHTMIFINKKATISIYTMISSNFLEEQLLYSFKTVFITWCSISFCVKLNHNKHWFNWTKCMCFCWPHILEYFREIQRSTVYEISYKNPNCKRLSIVLRLDRESTKKNTNTIRAYKAWFYYLVNYFFLSAQIFPNNIK